MASQAPSHSATFSTAALVVCSGILGYWVGVGRSLNLTRGGSAADDGSSEDEGEKKGRRRGEESEDSDVGDVSELGQVKAGLMEDCKMVLVVRQDLGMTKGKIAAQCGHATLACYKSLLKGNPTLLRHWERTGQAKIALKSEGGEEELLLLQAQATSLGMAARTIQDAGRTQIAAGSTTVLGIGPAPVKLVNQVTGHLKLLHYSTLAVRCLRPR